MRNPSRENPNPPAETAGASLGRRRVLIISVVLCVLAGGWYLAAARWRQSRFDPAALTAEALRAAGPASPASPGDEAAESEMQAIRKEALGVGQRLVEENPEAPDALSLFGLVLGRFGNRAGAVRCWQRCLEVSPGSADACLCLGWDALAQGDRRQAARWLREALQNDPSTPRDLLSSGEALSGEGRTEEAIEVYRKHLEPALRPIERWFRPDQGDVAAMREGLAATYLAAGKMYAARGSADRAEAHWRQAVEACPEETESRLTLVSLYESRGQLEEAVRLLDAGRSIAPNNPLYHLRLGMLNVQLDRLEAAEAAFRRATELAPARPESYVALAQLYVYRGRDPTRAKEAAETAVRLHPVAANYFLLGMVCERCGDLPGALAAVQRAMKLDPGRPEYRDAHDALLAKRQSSNKAGK